jgi:hypothetical protein
MGLFRKKAEKTDYIVAKMGQCRNALWLKTLPSVRGLQTVQKMLMI